MVTSYELFFFDLGSVFVEEEGFPCVHYNVNVAARYTSVLFGQGDGVSKEFFGDRKVEVFNVEYGALLFVLYG